MCEILNVEAKKEKKEKCVVILRITRQKKYDKLSGDFEADKTKEI